MNTTAMGSTPPRFVFLHGLFGRGRNWTTIARSLLPQSSLLVDLPNHADSHWTPRFSYEDMADEVAAMLVGVESEVCLVGHSMGGRVAMMTALRYPDLVERLVIEDTSMAPIPADDYLRYAQAMADVPLRGLRDRRQAREMLMGSISNEQMVSFLLANLRQTDQGQWHWSVNLDVLTRDMDQIAQWPHNTGTFTRPVLWITGAWSSYRGDDAQMRRAFPMIRRTVVKNAGHWVHADQPAVFTDQVRQFAKEQY